MPAVSAFATAVVDAQMHCGMALVGNSMRRLDDNETC
jgi:hypothetical protein